MAAAQSTLPWTTAEESQKHLSEYRMRISEPPAADFCDSPQAMRHAVSGRADVRVKRPRTCSSISAHKPWECNRPAQETVRCFVAMLRMGAEELKSPAAAQLERHVNQYVKARPMLSSPAVSAAVDRPRPGCTGRVEGSWSCRAVQ